MVNLALELVSITPLFNARLRVGITCGPAAGAVIGTLRAFYCLYGDTVNTAARMCKSAPPGRIHCTEVFSALIAEAGDVLGGVCAHDKGVFEVKGKGPMRIFDVCHTQDLGQENLKQTTSRSSSVPSIFCPLLGSEVLSSDSRAAWLKSPVRRIAPPLCTFADPALEVEFQTAAATSQRRLLTSGLVLNALATALEWRMGGRTALLGAHWGVSWAVASVCALSLGSENGFRSSVVSKVFLAQLVAHLCLGSAVSRDLEQTSVAWSWVLVFTTGMCLVTGWMGQPSVRNAVGLGVVALTTFYTGLAAHPIIAPRATEAALILVLATGMVSSSSPPRTSPPRTSPRRSLDHNAKQSEAKPRTP
jgi:hypothetical protein